jgi:hypothetical protein
MRAGVEITKHHVENGALAEILYRRIREAVEKARGRVVALRPSRLADMSAVRFVSRVLRELCLRRRGCRIHRRRNLVWYIFTVDALKSATLGELRQIVEALAKKEASPQTERPSRERMALISFHLPPELLRAMDELVSQGRYPNRSTIIREAIRQMLDRWRLAES